MSLTFRKSLLYPAFRIPTTAPFPLKKNMHRMQSGDVTYDVWKHQQVSQLLVYLLQLVSFRTYRIWFAERSFWKVVMGARRPWAWE